MKTRAIFYHAGCAVCVAAENVVPAALDRGRFDVEIVNFATDPGRIPEAERAGVVSVPAIVIAGEAFHINFGASMAAVKGQA